MHFQHAPNTQALIQRLETFMRTHILPLEAEIIQERAPHTANWREWTLDPRLEALKTLAQEQGLWNLFLPEISGLTHTEYATLAEITGHSLLAPEVFNCNAPDTGNMELIWKYGTEAQKERWLQPLLSGKIRSSFCMTEPAVASSDPTNLEASITQDGDHVILHGRKWWSTGLGHPNCKLLIFMGLSNPDNPKHAQHSMVLVDVDTPGVTIERMLPVFGTFDAPYGHGQVMFDHVRVPVSNVVGGLGRGFEIAQGRLGPGRVHHCMRLVGAAERALELMVRRGKARVAFGRTIDQLGGNRDIIAQARIDIEMIRLLVLKTAWLLDTVGVKGAMSEVSQIKVACPEVACRIIDQTMQMYGGEGLCDNTPLAAFYTYARILRLADGPDEVHRAVVAARELKKYE
jgi:acyl-CoA dehydrogenase